MVKYGKSRLDFWNGFSFKFSNADLLIAFAGREVFWLFGLQFWNTNLFGKITLPHDSPLTHISVGRLMFGLLTFTIYPGLWEHR
jgi:thiol:disulfide interchange protein DsbD